MASGHGEGGEGGALASQVQGFGTDRFAKICVMTNISENELLGWSRYDHFAVLCELLPVSIPSLVVNLMVVSLGGLEFAVSRRIHSALKCDNIKVSSSDSLPTLYQVFLQVLISLEELRQNPFQWDLTRCNWPGRKAFYLMNTYNIHRFERVGVKQLNIYSYQD